MPYLVLIVTVASTAPMPSYPSPGIRPAFL